MRDQATAAGNAGVGMGQPVPAPDELELLLGAQLQHRRDAGQFRQRRVIEPIDSTHARIDGRSVTVFSSNNYLGLTHHPRLIEAAKSAIDASGVGSGAAALVTGYTAAHAAAEAAIAAWKGTEAAVLLASGYQANVAAVQALAAMAQASSAGARFLIDKLAHASLIDAVRASGLPFRVFPHNHVAKLERLLAEREAAVQLQVVITESIFSMDGDAADLAGLAQLKQKHPFTLLLDEAHATGVYGPAGRGYAAEQGLQRIVDVSVITLSKALGCVGGAICASGAFCDAVVNFGRAYIYSTAIPPFVARVAQAAIEVLHDEPQRQQRVRALALHVRTRLRERGFHIPPGDSPIVPIVFGSEAAALEASAQLLERGLVIPAIRPPTVRRGTSRLRLTLSSDHTDGEIAELVSVISRAEMK